MCVCVCRWVCKVRCIFGIQCPTMVDDSVHQFILVFVLRGKQRERVWYLHGAASSDPSTGSIYKRDGPVESRAAFTFYRKPGQKRFMSYQFTLHEFKVKNKSFKEDLPTPAECFYHWNHRSCCRVPNQHILCKKLTYAGKKCWRLMHLSLWHGGERAEYVKCSLWEKSSGEKKAHIHWPLAMNQLLEDRELLIRNNSCLTFSSIYPSCVLYFWSGGHVCVHL